MRALPIIALLLLAASAVAQIRVDRPIELNSADPAQRQITGLPGSIAPDAVISAEIELTNPHRFAGPANGALWQIDLEGLDQGPQAGMHLLVRSPAPTNGPLQVMVNENGPFDITYGASDNVEGSSIPEGTILSIVFDGNVFQLMNGSARMPRECPEGSVAVSEQFCVQIERAEPMEFWDAIQACGAQGMRLCSWAEFLSACTNSAVLGLQNIPAVWEWTNNTANEDGSVRIAGNGTCQAATTADPTSLRNFRCCFTR